MLIIALVLVLLAVGLFAFQAIRENFVSMIPPGLALFAGGVAAYIYWVGNQAGKF